VDVSERTTPNGRGLVALLKATASDFSRDKCTLRAAALSYSTVFALPPLLILLIKLAGLVWDPQSVQRAIETEFAGLIGIDAAATVGQMVRSGNTATHSTMTTILGFGGLVLGATGAFLSLQDALNAVWEIEPDPRHGGVKRLIASRLLSFGIVLGLAFLLIVSLAVTAAIAAVSHAIGGATVVIEIVNMALSLGTLSLLVAAMYKFLPDAIIGWRSVCVGAIATTVLLGVGKFAIGLYLGRSNPGNAFGAASALAVILVWIYYAGALVLAGAEFTQQYSIARGHAIQPKPGFVRVDRGGFAR
jgi:membrane protein